jgi:folate-binding Fe-S cluster repair protein YgfZ
LRLHTYWPALAVQAPSANQSPESRIVPALILPDRSLIRVEGADAQHFLQNLITTNIDAIAPGEASTGGAADAAGQDPVRFSDLEATARAAT